MKRIMCIGVLALAAHAQESGVDFTFSTFSVPGAVVLGVESINDNSVIGGYYMDAAGNYKGFVRSAAKVLTTYADPADTRPLTFTESYQINDAGVAVCQFFNSAENADSGFFYNTGTQTYTTYDVPGQPEGTTTAVLGINSNGSQFCGYLSAPPYTTTSAFISVNGKVTVYSVNGSTLTECTGMNATGFTVGFYNDASGVSHGFMRSLKGAITVVDYPGASTTAAPLPCGGTAGGTVLSGTSDREDTSGYYWDTEHNEHGFARSPDASYSPINYPGAFQTGAGGTNTHGTVVGFYLDTACNPSAYIAYRPAGGH